MGEKWSSKEGGLDDKTIEKVLHNITDPGERAEKEQRLRQFNELTQKLARGEITNEEYANRMSPWLDGLK